MPHRSAEREKAVKVMRIEIDCKYLTGKFSKGVCLAHSADKEERCEGECEDCKKKEEKS